MSQNKMVNNDNIDISTLYYSFIHNKVDMFLCF